MSNERFAANAAHKKSQMILVGNPTAPYPLFSETIRLDWSENPFLK